MIMFHYELSQMIFLLWYLVCYLNLLHVKPSPHFLFKLHPSYSSTLPYSSCYLFGMHSDLIYSPSNSLSWRISLNAFSYFCCSLSYEITSIMSYPLGTRCALECGSICGKIFYVPLLRL